MTPHEHLGRRPDDRRDARATPAAPARNTASGPRAELLDLQRVVGNRAVTGLLGPNAQAVPVQRTALEVAAAEETLYNQRPGPDSDVAEGTAGAATYGGGAPAKFDMTRTDAGARIEVRIKFVSQDRDTQRRLPDGTKNPNYLQHLESPSAIPADDERRAWINDTLLPSLSSNWDGKIKLVGTRTPPPAPADPVAGVPEPPAPEPVELPVTFAATAVWDPAVEGVHETIRVYGSGTTASPAAGHPIDAGNYYMNMGNYGGTAEATFAHEYGHLLGLNDEYSQSNAQMHALLHQVSPTLGGERGQTLDRATVKRMVLAAMTPPLLARLRGASQQLGAAFRSVRTPVAARLAAALRGGAGAVRDPLTEILSAAATPAIGPRARHIAEFQTGANFSNRSLADQAVASTLAPGALTATVATAYQSALLEPHRQKVSVGGGPSGDIKISIAGGPARGGLGVWGALREGPQAADAGALADRLVGPAGRVPPVAPPTSLLARIESLPGDWSPEWIAAFVDESKTTTLMTTALESARALLEPASVTGVPALYVQARTLVQNAARAAAETQVQQLLAFDVEQVLTDHTGELQTEIDTAVEQVMNTPAGAVAAAAPPDPHMTAVVDAMQQRLAAQAPAQPAGRTHSQPTLDATGSPVASQEITYRNTGMMSDNSGDLRPDQFGKIAEAFNDKSPELRHADESDFRAERI